MKDTISTLRATALENIKKGQHPMDAGCGDQTGVLLSNQEAINIANALEHLTAPPLVLAAINILQLASEAEHLSKYEWAAIDYDGLLCLYKSRPRLGRIDDAYWVIYDGADETSLGNIPVFVAFAHKQMLFFRSGKGWEWIGDKQDIKEQQ